MTNTLSSYAAELAQKTATPALWARTVTPNWKLARHLSEIDRALMEMETGRSKTNRLMVFMPPRHGKSYLISRHYPAWHVGTNPDHAVIVTSHTHKLAGEFGAAGRDLMKEFGQDHFGIDVSKTSQSKEEWRIARRAGVVKASGIGGPLTGSGADLFIIDDPVKNAEQAISATYRDKTWNWWQSTASTRLEPFAKVVLMNTRWHDDDLAGRILREEGDIRDGGRWRVLSLPAIAEEDDELGRAPGEALWPERWPIEKLREIEKDKTAYWWGAMYQQRPGQFGETSWPAEYFENIWADEWPDGFDLSAMAIDPAMGKDKKRGDYQAVVFVGRSGGKVYADIKMRRIAPPQLVDLSVSWWQVLKPSAFVCESNGFQELLGSMIIQKTQELGAFDCICQSQVATGNKEIRIERDLTPLLARGLLKIRKDSPDTRKLYDQMRAFPNADHDDGPDALALAISTLRSMAHGKERVIGQIG